MNSSSITKQKNTKYFKNLKNLNKEENNQLNIKNNNDYINEEDKFYNKSKFII